MKWENRDINFTKQANTAKFNKLDNIWTHFLTILDALGGMIVGYTKLYSQREKADTGLENF